MTSTNQTTYTQFQTFQSDQTARFLEFQNKQVREVMTRDPSTKTDIELVGSEQTQKSKKKVKGPKKPKGARNAYTYFERKYRGNSKALRR